MPYYFMRDTPLQALEQLMMSQPGQKPRGGGIYRSPFRYTPEDVACEYCQNYVRKHPCRLCECTCLEERIEAGVLELNAFMRDCFTPSMCDPARENIYPLCLCTNDWHERHWRWCAAAAEAEKQRRHGSQQPIYQQQLQLDQTGGYLHASGECDVG